MNPEWGKGDTKASILYRTQEGCVSSGVLVSAHAKLCSCMASQACRLPHAATTAESWSALDMQSVVATAHVKSHRIVDGAVEVAGACASIVGGSLRHLETEDCSGVGLHHQHLRADLAVSPPTNPILHTLCPSTNHRLIHAPAAR